MQDNINRPSLDIECTVGVVYLDKGMLFFKNRDLAHEYHLKQLSVYHSTPDIFAMKGNNLKTGDLEGVAFGVNRHKVCVANTHVESTDDVTYDVLCEALLSQVRSKGDVPRILDDFMSQNTLQGGRILVAAPKWAFLIEVFRVEFRLQEIEGSIAITNNFSLISHQATRAKIRDQSSLKRLEVASRLIEGIKNIRTLKSMLRSHIPEKGELSICNHQQGGGGTESSHIVHIHGDYVGWSSLTGFPCENDYSNVQLFQG